MIKLIAILIISLLLSCSEKLPDSPWTEPRTDAKWSDLVDQAFNVGAHVGMVCMEKHGPGQEALDCIESICKKSNIQFMPEEFK